MIPNQFSHPRNFPYRSLVVSPPKAPESTTYSGASRFEPSLLPLRTAVPELPRCLFVGDIPLLCNEERLFALFSPLGRIESIQLKRDEQSSHRSPKSPSTLITNKSHQLSVSGSNRYFQSPQPYADNPRPEKLPLQQQQLHLSSLSSQSSQSSQQEQRNHLSYGFVKFVAHEDAVKAVRELNGAFVLGRRIRVSWARDNPGLELLSAEALQSTTGASATGRKTAQIHVLYMTPMIHVTISEMDLHEVFREFGEVLDVTIKKSVMNKVMKEQIFQ